MSFSGPEGHGVVRNSGKRYVKAVGWCGRVMGKEADKG